MPMGDPFKITVTTGDTITLTTMPATSGPIYISSSTFDSTDAPPGHLAVPANQDVCAGCAFLQSRNAVGEAACPKTAKGDLRCLGTSRKDVTRVIFMAGQSRLFDPTDAPAGYTAVPRGRCSGCAFWDDQMQRTSSGCPRDQKNNLRCVQFQRKDGTEAIFKKVEPAPVDIGTFDNATIKRAINFLLDVARKRGMLVTDDIEWRNP